MQIGWVGRNFRKDGDREYASHIKSIEGKWKACVYLCMLMFSSDSIAYFIYLFLFSSLQVVALSVIINWVVTARKVQFLVFPIWDSYENPPHIMKSNKNGTSPLWVWWDAPVLV